MAIRFQCPECGKRLRVRDEHAGRKTRCVDCSEIISVPDGNDDWETDDDDESMRSQSSRSSRSNGRMSSRARSESTVDQGRSRKKGSSKGKSESESSGGIPMWAIVTGLSVLV